MTSEEMKKLEYNKKTVYETKDPAAIDAAYAYAEGYTRFLDSSKTEREAVISAVKLAEAEGFTEWKLGDPIAKGGKYYLNNRGKNLFLFSVGTESPAEGIRISAAHIDSPRLDLKQVPLYEESGLCYLKTHYYGGIRKYQWLALPLALHGRVVRADGEKIDIVIGEAEDDPVFYITDLLPHLGAKDNAKPLGDAVPAEKLNLLTGSRPAGESDGVKLNILRILNEKYGISEEDFLSAELSAVPAGKARDCGLDRSMIASYGHDDRVCAYPALTALFESAGGPHTLICILADKEEVGSDGNTGMQCELMLDIIDEISKAAGCSPAAVRSASLCLSADVSAAFDPNFAEAFEKRNTAILSSGVVLTKYTGSRGKSGTNDASAEYIGRLRKIMAEDSVVWQAGELGRVDYGGGGTVAKFISKHNIETVDLGVPVLSMHAPCEVISKVDLYEAHRAFSAFNRY